MSRYEYNSSDLPRRPVDGQAVLRNLQRGSTEPLRTHTNNASRLAKLDRIEAQKLQLRERRSAHRRRLQTWFAVLCSAICLAACATIALSIMSGAGGGNLVICLSLASLIAVVTGKFSAVVRGS
jgi:hypothetical protein